MEEYKEASAESTSKKNVINVAPPDNAADDTHEYEVDLETKLDFRQKYQYKEHEKGVLKLEEQG